MSIYSEFCLSVVIFLLFSRNPFVGVHADESLCGHDTPRNQFGTRPMAGSQRRAPYKKTYTPLPLIRKVVMSKTD